MKCKWAFVYVDTIYHCQWHRGQCGAFELDPVNCVHIPQDAFKIYEGHLNEAGNMEKYIIKTIRERYNEQQN